MPHRHRSKEELARLAHEIYEREIRDKVEPGQAGRFLALDVESGDYEVADDDLAASDGLFRRRPDAVAFMLRVGYSASYGIGARPRRAEEASASFSLMGEGAVVWFEARGYGIPEKPSRGPDWLVGAFRASVGPWGGSFEGAVLHDELERLSTRIEVSLGLPEFEVAFAPADPYLEFETKSFQAGQPAAAPRPGREVPEEGLVSVEGRLNHEPILGTELRFAFVSDRTRLRNTARGLRHVLATFPDRVGRAGGTGAPAP